MKKPFKLRLNFDYEEQEIYKGEFTSFPKARKLLKDLEKKVR